MIFLSDDMLNKLTTRRLLAYYRSIRSFIHNWYWDFDPDDSYDLEECLKYKEKVKSILDTREHIAP